MTFSGSHLLSGFGLLLALTLTVNAVVHAAALPPANSGNGAQQQRANADPSKDGARRPQGTEGDPIFIKNLSGPESKTDEPVRQYEREEKPSLERWLTWSTVALAVSTFLLFVFTACLWWVTYQLSKDARDASTRQAKDTAASIQEATRAATAMEDVALATKNNANLMQGVMHQQMRAYISADIGGATYQEHKLKFAGHLQLENTGFTPARKVAYWVKADILPTDLSVDFEFPKGVERVTDVGVSPRQKFVVTCVVENVYPDAEVREILQGDVRRLYVWGVVKYEDIFGKPWETDFCHSYDFLPAAENGKYIPRGVFHSSHNSAT